MIGSLRCALGRAGSYLVACSCALVFSGSLQAADVFWEGDAPGDPTDWAEGENWTGGVIPGGGDNARIENGLTARVGSDVGIINEIHVSNGSRMEVVAGGAVLPDGSINIGDVAGQTGELLVTGGSLDGFTTANFGINGGQATVRQTGGAVLFSNDTVSGSINAGFHLGRDAGAVAVYNLEGGELTQGTSGSVDNGDSWNHIGRFGAEATFNLSGGTASFNARTHVGFAGKGTVNQSGGLFEVRNMELVLGDDLAGQGTYNMTGGDLRVMGTDAAGALIRDIQVGHWQDTVGHLNVSGGRIETRDINLGNYRGAQGFMDVSGDAEVQVNGWLRVGNGEGDPTLPGVTGNLRQTGGNINIVGRLMVGQNDTATGVYDMEGGTVTAGDWSTIGGPDGGHGTFNLSGGTATFTDRFHVGGETGSTGILNQTGGTLRVIPNAADTDNNPDMLVADGRGSRGEFNLNGGEALLERDLLIGNWSRTEGHVNVNDGLLSVTRNTIIGGGTNTDIADVGDDGILGTPDDNYRATNHGFMRITGGETRLQNDLVIGDGFNSNGQLDVEGGELTVGQWTYIGRGYLDDAGTIYGSNGVFNMTGGHATFEARVGVGVNGTGTLNQTGGRIDYTDAKASGIAFHIGDQATGKGVYNLSGGEAIVSGGRVQIGHWRGLDATMNVSGTGVLRTTTDVHVGSEVDVNEQLTAENHGTLNQTGGLIDIGGNMILGVFDRSNGDVNLSGGELHNRNNVIVGDAGVGTFTHTGGSHTVEGDLTIGVQAGSDGLYTLDGDGVLDMTGGSMSYGAGVAQFAFDGGTLKDAGTINFNLVNNGGTLAPGGSPGVTNILGDYSVTSASATYQVEIGGLLQGTEYDFLNVTGETALTGRLQVLLGADGPVLGDTNGDGTVDLEDLNNVRNNFGESGLGDTNGDNVVDLDDLNNVRNNFGETSDAFTPEIGNTFTILASAGGVSGTFSTELLPPLPADRHWNVDYGLNDVQLQVLAGPAVVPEPTTLGLGVMLALGAGWWIRRKK
jgi:fibronectin-binding autotransporter adhesin